MEGIDAVPGSFRDPAGRVFRLDGQIFRTVTAAFAPDFDFVESTGLLEKLVNAKLLLPFERIPSSNLPFLSGEIKYILRSPQLEFISYPYEWSFSALKAAAVLQLDIQLLALEFGVTLTDASAYNIQFQGARPAFIDHLSFRRYRPGEIWTGHRQFCEQFLNPLLLHAFLGVQHNAWYRGTQEGIKAQELSHLLRWRHYLSWTVWTHVALPSFFQRSVEDAKVTLEKGSLPANVLPVASFRRLLEKLRSWIMGLNPAGTRKTVWREYTKTSSYSSEEAARKRQFVRRFVGVEKPRIIWDLGCNTGDYSAAALEAGAEYAVGFDTDHGALELAFLRAKRENLAFQPIFFDAANPSPNQGWREKERSGLQARASADAILALALVHHLAISNNIPLDQLIGWIVGLAPRGVIEFVPKSDPMVQSLLRLREDIFPNYTPETFLNYLTRIASITGTEVVSSTGRLLVSYTRQRQ
jgi:ribosomal protein L11 methylase PrmA